MSRQSRRWLGTWFPIGEGTTNPGPDILDFCSYYVGAIELAPSTGKKHVQFYAFLKQKKTLKGAVSKFQSMGWVGVHLEACRGTHEDCIRYIIGPYSKDGKTKPKRDDYDEYGNRPSDEGAGNEKWKETLQLAQAGRFAEIDPSIQITQFRNLRYVFADNNDAKDLDRPCGYWIWGPSGVGKSTMARNFGPAFDKDCNKWWCGYRNEPVAILDDLGPAEAKGMDRWLKIWADKFAFSPEIKGHHLGKIRPTHFVVTSQYSIETLFADPETRNALLRRFEVIHIFYDGTSRIIDRQPRSSPPAAMEEVLPAPVVEELSLLEDPLPEFAIGEIGEEWDTEFPE